MSAFAQEHSSFEVFESDCGDHEYGSIDAEAEAPCTRTSVTAAEEATVAPAVAAFAMHCQDTVSSTSSSRPAAAHAPPRNRVGYSCLIRTTVSSTTGAGLGTDHIAAALLQWAARSAQQAARRPAP